MTASDEARRWRSSPQRVSPGTVTMGTHAADHHATGAAARPLRAAPDRRQHALGTPTTVRRRRESRPPSTSGLVGYPERWPHRSRSSRGHQPRLRRRYDPDRQAVPTAVLVRRQRGLELGPKQVPTWKVTSDWSKPRSMSASRSAARDNAGDGGNASSEISPAPRQPRRAPEPMSRKDTSQCRDGRPRRGRLMADLASQGRLSNDCCDGMKP
jgi:hypothetical protein